MVKMKCRAIGKGNKSKMRFMPAGSTIKGFFGLTSISENSKSVCLTEGEFDAMSVYQSTNIPSISLPNGVNHLPLELIPLLEQFDMIYLWLDADNLGRQNALNFAKKLGSKRTLIIDSRRDDPNGPKDANDAMREGYDLFDFFRRAYAVSEKNVASVKDMQKAIMDNIYHRNKLMGIPSSCFDFYNKTTKGLRRGEFSILTGPTGSGKTTFLSQLSLDMAQQGVPTLWGSFEIKPELLATTMLHQSAKKDVFKD